MTLHWETTVIALIAFGILYFLLNKYAFGPLFSIMDKRADHIKQQLDQAEQNRTSAEKLLEEQKAAIQQAKKEAYDMLEQARQSSAKQADDIVAAAKADAERIKQDALREIESEKNKAVAALRSQVSAMSVMIASKIIEKQIDEKSQQELVEKYLGEVGGRS